MLITLRNNGLAIVTFGLFAIFLAGQTVAGHISYNQQEAHRGHSPISYVSYLATGHNIEAIFENWESEFLQLFSTVLLTVFLFQKGSAVSKKLEVAPGPTRRPRPEAPWPARRGGWARDLYKNSLTLAFLSLFLFSLIFHAIGGSMQYNHQQLEKGRPAASLLDFLGTSDFWFQSLQNYQSEFLALGSMAVLSIYYRQKGSPQSKAVDAPYAMTGKG